MNSVLKNLILPKTTNSIINDLNNKNVSSQKEILKTEQISLKTKQQMEIEELFVNILHIENPSKFFIRYFHRSTELDKLHTKLQDYCQNTIRDETTWQVSMSCIALSNDNEWQRGIVTQYDENSDLITVFFKDIGKEEKLSIHNLLRIPDRFLNIKNGAIKCYITGILPAMGNNWPNITIEYFKNINLEYDKFYIKIDGTKNENGLPVKLYALYINDEDALEPTQYEWKSVGDMIVLKGLAIREMKQSSLNTDDECSEQPKETIVKVERSPFSKKLKVNSNWLPAPLPNSREFDAIPTFIDENLNVYLYQYINKEFLQDVITQLSNKFENSEPHAEDMFWSKEQLCIAQWEFDGKFYRAVIKDILDNNNLKVYFVDYGNDEICHVSKLRKDIITENIPIQTFKCKVVGIKPKDENEWNDNIIDEIHHLIVEKKCHISILGLSKNGTVCVNLKINNTSLIDWIYSSNYGIYDSLPEMEIYKIQDVQKVNLSDTTSDDDIVIDE